MTLWLERYIERYNIHPMRDTTFYMVFVILINIYQENNKDIMKILYLTRLEYKAVSENNIFTKVNV